MQAFVFRTDGVEQLHPVRSRDEFVLELEQVENRTLNAWRQLAQRLLIVLRTANSHGSQHSRFETLLARQ